jgi:NTP pyrophosphatase (non-canonical NTP hydrolase)
VNGALGLSGEAGECADHVKKHLFQGHELDRAHLAEEIGDVLWYCAELASGIGRSLDEIAEMNIAKLRKRYPDGFDSDRSVHRDEYEVIEK